MGVALYVALEKEVPGCDASSVDGKFLAKAQTKPDPFLQVILRINGPSATVTAQVTQAVAELNRAISISYQTMRDTVEQSLLRERLMATLSGFFGALAALLAAIGLYVGALPFIGFRIATFLFVAGLQATLEPPRTVKAWLLMGITALVTTAVAYVVFERYLQVFLPRGRWTDF